MSHPLTRAAAILAVVILVSLWWAIPQPSVAFGDFLALIVNAKTAKFQCTIATDVRGMQTEAVGYFRAPAHFRQEIGQPAVMTTIADFERGRMLTLMPDKKEAMIFEIKGNLGDDKMRESNFFGNLRATLERYRKGDDKVQVEELGEQDLAGRRVFGFRVLSTGQTQTLWGEVATGRPVRVETSFLGPPKTDVVMSDFEFDVPLDESLFSIEPPADYKSFTVPMDATPPSEQDMIASLRTLSDALDGAFPQSLDTPGIAVAFAKIFKGMDSTEEMMKKGAPIGRGLQFTLRLPVSADAHYAGKGVKRNGPRTPIFWYRQEKSGRFRVIFNDLTAEDADKAPEVPGAIRMVDQLKAADPSKAASPESKQAPEPDPRP